MIIVTGGAGFIGSNLVKALNNRGIDEIVIVDDLENGEKIKNLRDLEIMDFIPKDDFILNLEEHTRKCDVIFHLGANTNTMEYNGNKIMKDNYIYSKKLLDFCIKRGIRFIYASSASIYGNKCFREDRTCEDPLNPYAYSKYLFDQYVRRLIKTAKIQIVGLRFFNVYGPREFHKGKMASVALQFYLQLRKNGTIKLFEGSEKFKRDFIYVDDVVNVALFFFDNEDKNGIFNCGTGKAESFLKVAKLLIKYVGDGKIEYISFPETLRGKYQYFTQADLTKLRNAGYKKRFIDLEEGIKSYVKYLDKNVEYYLV